LLLVGLTVSAQTLNCERYGLVNPRTSTLLCVGNLAR
jgi:hypothetical protein